MAIAIETRYKGHRFRSRLEARWAIYFDAEGIRWEYEKEGYVLNNGKKYLPDFWLPDVKMFAEVKPEPFTREEIDKCERLPFPCLLLDGLPRKVVYYVVHPIKKDGGPSYDAERDSLSAGEIENCIVSSYHNYHLDEKRFYTDNGRACCDEVGNLIWDDEYRSEGTDCMYWRESFDQATGARFEFSESK